VQINPDVAEFSQWNDSVGQTLRFNYGMDSWALVQYSQTLSPGTFSGGTASLDPSPTNAYVGFRVDGNVGWFFVDFNGGQFNPITYGPGQFGSMGESVIVGIPEPSTAGLAMLALGAAGLARKRKK
jgi:hypothetical protein